MSKNMCLILCQAFNYLLFDVENKESLLENYYFTFKLNINIPTKEVLALELYLLTRISGYENRYRG